MNTQCQVSTYPWSDKYFIFPCKNIINILEFNWLSRVYRQKMEKGFVVHHYKLVQSTLSPYLILYKLNLTRKRLMIIFNLDCRKGGFLSLSYQNPVNV